MNKFLNNESETYVCQPEHKYICIWYVVRVKTNYGYSICRYFGNDFADAWKFYTEQKNQDGYDVSLWDESSFRGNFAGYPVPKLEKKRIA